MKMQSISFFERTQLIVSIVCPVLLAGCRQEPVTGGCVTVHEFSRFVEATGYRTEAERIGTGFLVENVFRYREVPGAYWKKPDGEQEANPAMPVTQVSYNDATAYCKWANKSLYREEDWWKVAGHDARRKNYASMKIEPDESVNMIGNTWEWTQETYVDELGTPYAHAVGGSYLCEENTCQGWKKENIRQLSLDSASDIVSFRVK